MEKKIIRATRLFVFAMAFVMVASVFAIPSEASAAAYTATKVSGVKVVDKSYNAVKFTWNKVSKTEKYQIYRSTTKNGTYKLIKTTTSNTFTNTGLTTGKTYYYKIRGYKTVKGKKQYTKYSNKFGTYAQIDTPAESAAGSTTGITIKWTKESGAQGYQIYRAPKGGSYSKIKTINTTTVNSTGAKVTDTSAEPGRVYYYKVRAYRKVGKTYKYSAYSTAKTGVKTLATPSLNYAAAAGPARTVTLSWKATPKASGYYVYRYNPSTKKYVAIKKTTATSFTDTKRDYGQTYGYYVKAYRTVSGVTNYSANSAAKTATINMSTTTVKVTAKDASSVSLSWNQLAPGVDGYRVYAKEGKNGKFYLKATLNSPSTTSVKISGLKEGTTYYFAVCGIASQYSNGKVYMGASSNEASATTALAAPNTPTLGMTADHDNGKFTLKWNAVAKADKYAIYVSINGGEYKTLGSIAGTSIVLDEVERGVPYEYKVRAVRGSGSSALYSGYSNVVKGQLAEETKVVGTPTASITADHEAGTFQLSWTECENAEKYIIYEAIGGADYVTRGSTTKTSITITDAERLVTCKYKIRAVMGTTYSAYSNEVTATLTEDPNKLGTPSATTVVNMDGPFVEIAWESCANADGYEVVRKVNNSTDTVSFTTTETYYQDTTITIGETYTYTVRAYKTVNGTKTYSEYSAAVNVEIKLETPVISAKVNEEESSITLTWTESKGADKYILYKASGDAEYETLGSVNATQYVDADIDVENNYSYKVKAVKDTASGRFYSDESEVKISAINPGGGAGGTTPEVPKDPSDSDEDDGFVVIGNATITINKPATGSSRMTITLDWPYSDESELYSIYRSTKPNGEFECILENLHGGRHTDSKVERGKTYYYKIYLSGVSEPVATVYGSVPDLTHDTISEHDWNPVLNDNIQYTKETVRNFAVCENCYFSTLIDIYEHIDAERGDSCGDFTTGQSFSLYKNIDTGEYVTEYTCDCGATRIFELE